MHLSRFFTRADRDIYADARFRSVKNEEWLEYTVPLHWGQAAVDVLLEKVFYPQGLPAITRKVAEPVNSPPTDNP